MVLICASTFLHCFLVFYVFVFAIKCQLHVLTLLYMIQCNRFPFHPLYVESYVTAAFDAESVVLGLVMVGHRNATIAAKQHGVLPTCGMLPRPLHGEIPVAQGR